MSKKKFLATALLSVSLLGAGVVSADVDPLAGFKENPEVPAVQAEGTVNVGPKDTTVQSGDKKVVYSAVTGLKKEYLDKDNKVVDEGSKEAVAFQYVVTGELKVDGKTDTMGRPLYVTVAGKAYTTTSEAGHFSVTLPKNELVNGNEEVSVYFTTGNELPGTTLKVKVASPAQQVSYAEGVITVSYPQATSYLKVTDSKGAVSVVEVKATDKEYKVKVGELANGSKIELYASKEEADKKDAKPLASYTVAAKTPMYRVYNANTGEHHYTVDENEYKVLTTKFGWTAEGVAWQAPTAGKPVYRLYNPNNGDHHYTLDKEEKAKLEGYGWTYEGVGFYSNANDSGVNVYRLYNPNAKGAGSHHYTIEANEANQLKALGWTLENTSAWFVAE